MAAAGEIDVVSMCDMLEQDLAKPEPRQELQEVREAFAYYSTSGQNHRFHVAVSVVAVVPGRIYAENIARQF